MEEIEGDNKSQSAVVSNINTADVKKKEIQYIYWIFTYNNYEESIIQDLIKYFDENCTKYIFQKEIGDNTGTPHLQGAFTLKKKKRFSEIMNKPIHFSYLEKSNSKASEDYCSKDRTSQGEVYCKGIVLLDIISRKQFYPWQEELYKILIGTPDKRKIYWYWEKDGNVGKTSFVKYMVHNHKALFTNGGKNNDIINLVFNQLDPNRSPNIIFWDLPRENRGRVSYSAIESIKNGMIQNNKYETGMKLFNSPHIVIFSNYSPNIDDELSSDRLVVVQLTSPPQI